MSTQTAGELTEVLERVKTWPSGLRLTLARRILELIDASSAPSQARPRGLSAAEIIALIKPPSPAPNDEECRQILEEELVEEHSA